MSEEDDSKGNPEIKEVLKALNHGKRRDILLYLKDLGRETGFSELMDYLDVDPKTSGQFSYHIKLLVSAHLIQKQNDKYQITSLGLKACSMLDLVDISENESIVQKISNSYKNTTIFDQILIAFIAFTAILFIIPLQVLFLAHNSLKESPVVVILVFVGAVLFSLITSFAYMKLKYIPSLLILSSMIWVIFLPYNQIKIGVIYMGSTLGLIFIFQALFSSVNNNVLILNYILAVICFLGTIFALILIFYNETLKKEEITQ